MVQPGKAARARDHPGVLPARPRRRRRAGRRDRCTLRAASRRAGAYRSVNLTMPLATWLAASSEPGKAPGCGPLPAEDARGLADLIARQPGARWCNT